MKPFTEITTTGQLIQWELSDYAISVQFYTAQELKDLHGMIILAMSEISAGKNAIINEFITTFKESFFDPQENEHTKVLSELVTISLYEQELLSKVKLCDYYSYLKVPSCFVN